MRHIIAILLQNEAGALARVAGMFSARGYNIDALSVAPTHDPAVSRLTLITQGSDGVIHQIIQQTRKMVDVVDIQDLSASDHLECELLMIKLEVRNGAARQVVECARRHRAVILDETDHTRMVQLAGTGPEIDAFVAEVGRIAPILELVRSGVAAMQRGHELLSLTQDASAV
ncbi:MAG: acetolactate synthase small subunit [Panacagrimonas sp.]